MYTQTTITLIVMIITFALSSWKLKSPEISMAITAVVGAAVAGFGFPEKLIVEGMFSYFDVGLIFVTASIFINIYSETGAMNSLVRNLVDKFYDKKWILLYLLGILMLIPGGLTGAGSVSIFVVGGMVSTVLYYMGFPKKHTVAFIFIFAALSAAAPPINLWAMLMCAGANMPYVNFEIVLLVPILLIASFTIFFLGRGKTPQAKDKILAELPKPPADLGWSNIIIPALTFITLILLRKYAAFSTPVFGMPLIFVISSFVTIILSKHRADYKKWYKVITDTMEQVFPLLATVISVGMLVNIMAASGVKGLLGITFITLPVYLIYATALIFCPLAQGSLSYGSSIILGVPIVFLFNSVGLNTTIVVAALSLMFPLGDAMPPSRIVGRLSIETVGYEGSYISFLKQILVPGLVMGGIGLIMLMFPNTFSFLII